MGNRLVDELAKSGVEEAPGFGRAAVMTQVTGEVKWAIRHIAGCHATADFPDGWPDVTPWKHWEGSLPEVPLVATPPGGHQLEPHTSW